MKLSGKKIFFFSIILFISILLITSVNAGENEDEDSYYWTTVFTPDTAASVTAQVSDLPVCQFLINLMANTFNGKVSSSSTYNDCSYSVKILEDGSIKLLATGPEVSLEAQLKDLKKIRAFSSIKIKSYKE